MSGGWFHGGPTGLAVGQRILPPSVTGAPMCAGEGDPASVYVHRGPDSAALYAVVRYGTGGQLYEVSPVGELQPDPETPRGKSGEVLAAKCEAARIVRLVNDVAMSNELQDRELALALLAQALVKNAMGQ